MADPTDATLPTLDPEMVKATLSAPPFVTVDGIFNIRDFGAGYASAAAPSTRVKPRRLFRAGELSHISPAGVAQLRALGVTTVFDLRAEHEIAKYKSATPAIDGVEFVRTSILEQTLDPVGIVGM